MSMTIKSSVKDKILATQSETSKVRQNVVIDALRRKEEVKPRCVRAMAMTIQYGHPQADGQSERMIQTLEDTLRACVTDFGGSYQLRIRCASFEALYGRKCRSRLYERSLKAASTSKEFSDNRRKPLEFEVGDCVMLKVLLWKGVVRFGKKGKLALRYVGPFEILERIGPVAYRLRLPEELSGVHDTFHVSNLKKCLADASLHVSLDEIKVDKTLRFVEEPVENSDCEVMRLKCSRMVIVKVQFWLEARSLRLQQLIESLFLDIVVCRKPMILAQLYVDVLASFSGELNGAKIERSG
ncbi:putative reverse transcriptase domain-containing protein [Tanacetum coccineum]|uniref:Reverse transcriptase domain-containing protein n=1 Tax=Tanacetum coccineum TaxID=301880 RepID=A0ABQ5CYZ3_9ASTR